MMYKVIPGFMTAQECTQVIDYCRDRMSEGSSPDPNNNYAPVKSKATCNNMISFVRPEDHPAIEALTRRMEQLTGRPRAFYEPIQVLRYDPGMYYRLHVDNTYPHDRNPRKATFQIYLTDVEEGGETSFPKLRLSFRPQMGKAVYWYNFSNRRDNEAFPSADLETEHEGKTVVRGVKWTLTQWIKLWPVGTSASAPSQPTLAAANAELAARTG